MHNSSTRQLANSSTKTNNALPHCVSTLMNTAKPEEAGDPIGRYPSSEAVSSSVIDA